MHLTFAGKFWLIYVTCYLLTALFAIRAFAADADPNGFQYHERVIRTSCAQGTVLECALPRGTIAYCEKFALSEPTRFLAAREFCYITTGLRPWRWNPKQWGIES